MIALKTNVHRDLKTAPKKHYVKFMVSLRCERIVKSELKKLGAALTVSDNAIELHENVAQAHFDALKENLFKSGMVLLDESDSKLIDRIITTIDEMIHTTDRLPDISYNEIINKKIVLGTDFVLNIFSEVMGISILHYIVKQKVERVKELLLYSDLTLSEIASLLRYKNEDLLNAQFKKFTGLSTDYFLEIKRKRNKNFSGRSTA